MITVANLLHKIIQTRTKIEILKHSTVSLLLRIKKEYIKSDNSLVSLHVEDGFLSKFQILITKNVPKKTNPLTNSIAHTRSYNKP